MMKSRIAPYFVESPVKFEYFFDFEGSEFADTKVWKPLTRKVAKLLVQFQRELAEIKRWCWLS